MCFFRRTNCTETEDLEAADCRTFLKTILQLMIL